MTTEGIYPPMQHTVPFVRVVRGGQPAWRHICGRIEFFDLLSSELTWWRCPNSTEGGQSRREDWTPVFAYVGDLCDQCQGNGWVPISGKVDGALCGYETVTECTACGGSGLPYPLGPADYPNQLRGAVLEAEDNAEDYDTEGTRLFAMGLRVAAGMFGLPEGQDPATRRRAAAGELPADAFLPAHLRDDAPHQQCNGCGRKTWAVSEFGKTCGMAVFGGPACKGTFATP